MPQRMSENKCSQTFEVSRLKCRVVPCSCGLDVLSLCNSLRQVLYSLRVHMKPREIEGAWISQAYLGVS